MKANLTIELLRMAWLQAREKQTDVWYNFDDFTNVMEYNDDGDVIQEYKEDEAAREIQQAIDDYSPRD